MQGEVLEDRGSKVLQNNGNLLQHYTTSQTRRPQMNLHFSANFSLTPYVVLITNTLPLSVMKICLSLLTNQWPVLW